MEGQMGQNNFNVDLETQQVFNENIDKIDRRGSSIISTTNIGAILKLTQYKSDTQAIINMYNSFKQLDKRLMMLNKEKKQIIFINTMMECETKKITYDKIEKIVIKPREFKE